MPAEQERRDRLARALRANLRRRKDQARGRAEGEQPEAAVETADPAPDQN